jgi:hypothetical protein
VVQGSKGIYPEGISIGISPGYYGQNIVDQFSLFSPYYCPVIGSTVPPVAFEEHETMYLSG